MDKYFRLNEILFEIEAELRCLNLWDDKPPSVEKLSSTMPFCVDTLEFYQWLQFIMLPALYNIIQEGGSIALGAQIHPMAEECLAKDESMQRLLDYILKLDGVLA